VEQISLSPPKQKRSAKSKKTLLKKGLPASCYAYVPDPNKPETWKLPYRKVDGSIDKDHLKAAVAALSPGGYRGRKVRIPEEDLLEVKRKLYKAYIEIGVPEDKIPAGLK
jgi:hypothetical protein